MLFIEVCSSLHAMNVQLHKSPGRGHDKEAANKPCGTTGENERKGSIHISSWIRTYFLWGDGTQALVVSELLIFPLEHLKWLPTAETQRSFPLLHGTSV